MQRCHTDQPQNQIKGGPVRRIIPGMAAVLLTAGCAGTAHVASVAPSASLQPSAPVSAQPTTPPSATAGAPGNGRLQVVIPASKLPYKPATGAPALGNVTVLKTPADPCAVPADDSGNEAQLLNARLVGPVLIVSFEFTNPCRQSLAYDFTVTQAIGSEHGPSGGAPGEATSPVIPPRQSISFNVNVDPSSTLTSSQLQQLWVGISRITKVAAY